MFPQEGVNSKLLKKLYNNFEEIVGTLFLVATVVLVLLNIITRYFLKTGIYWSEEVATGCFVWAAYIGAAAAFKKGQHIGIDLLVKRLSGRKRAVIQVIVDLLVLLVIGFTAYFSVYYVATTHTKPTPVLEVSSAFISTALPVGFLLMVIRGLEALVRDIKVLREVE